MPQLVTIAGAVGVRQTTARHGGGAFDLAQSEPGWRQASAAFGSFDRVVFILGEKERFFEKTNPLSQLALPYREVAEDAGG